MGEGGEHVDAVDGARNTLLEANELSGGKFKFDQRAAAATQRKVTLSNGMKLSPGEISALMGDFYGAYTKGNDGVEHFDPMAAFNSLDNADTKEMTALLKCMRAEKADVDQAKAKGTPFEPTDAAQLEALTRNRPQRTDQNGTTTGYSFMDLAQKNSNHFSKGDESGSDNNIGAYSVLHQQAMAAAQAVQNLPPGPERVKAEQRALALEASSQHFLVDRFASGHQFDKAQMVNEAPSAMEGNMRARQMHNQLNENGARVEDANGVGWQAWGDSKWADPRNAYNRIRSSQATVASYSNVTDIMAGDKTAADFPDPAAVPHQMAPVWSESGNQKIQDEAKQIPRSKLAADNIGEIGVIPEMIKTAKAQRIDRPLEDLEAQADEMVASGASWAWEHAKSGAGKAWDWTREKGGDLIDGARRAWGAWGPMSPAPGAAAMPGESASHVHPAQEDEAWPPARTHADERTKRVTASAIGM